MKQDKYNWEEEFLEQLLGGENTKNIRKDLQRDNDYVEKMLDKEFCIVCGMPLSKNKHIDKLLEWLGKFRKDLISNERKRIIDSLPEERDGKVYLNKGGIDNAFSIGFDEGYNQCLKCLKEIKSNLEGK